MTDEGSARTSPVRTTLSCQHHPSTASDLHLTRDLESGFIVTGPAGRPAELRRSVDRHIAPTAAHIDLPPEVLLDRRSNVADKLRKAARGRKSAARSRASGHAPPRPRGLPTQLGHAGEDDCGLGRGHHVRQHHQQVERRVRVQASRSGRAGSPSGVGDSVTVIPLRTDQPAAPGLSGSSSTVTGCWGRIVRAGRDPSRSDLA